MCKNIISKQRHFIIKENEANEKRNQLRKQRKCINNKLVVIKINTRKNLKIVKWYAYSLQFAVNTGFLISNGSSVITDSWDPLRTFSKIYFSEIVFDSEIQGTLDGSNFNIYQDRISKSSVLA